jgi:hypothetical protein
MLPVAPDMHSRGVRGDAILVIALFLLGPLSLFLGYRLFCDIRNRTLTSLASGALLAIFGMGILIADIRNVGATGPGSHPAWQRKSSAHHRGVNTLERFV